MFPHPTTYIFLPLPVQLDKYICRSLGATTIKDLVKNKEVTGLTIKECDKIKANRPDVLILNKDKQIVVFISYYIYLQ